MRFGNLDCDGNDLTTLKGSPKIIGGNFDCTFNNLTSLEGTPSKIGGTFDCRFNKLTTLKGISKGVKDLQCSNNYDKCVEIEWEIRKENPDITDDEVNVKMIEKGYYDNYISDEVKEMFLF